MKARFMKMIPFTKKLALGMIISLALLSVRAPTARAQGGSVSGGADYPVDMKAWFTSDDLNATVKTCIEVGDHFGFSKEALQRLVQKSFQRWADDYIQIGGKLRQDDSKAWNRCSIDGTIRAGYRIATRMQMLDHCDGSEDLTIFFGVENNDIQARKKKYNFPFGFAELTDLLSMHLHQAPWSKGMIWIAAPESVDPKFQVPLWTNYDGAPLEMLLLHEMGHVFGNQHIDGTVMSADIGQFLEGKTDISKQGTSFAQFDPLNLQIDRNRYLVFTPELGFDLPFAPKAASCAPYDDDCVNRNRPLYEMVYKDLTGLDLQSNHFNAHFSKASFDLPSDPRTKQSLLQLLPSILSLNADGMNLDLNFTPVSILNDTPSGQAFQEGCSRDKEFSSNQISIYGYLKNPNITPKPMVLNVNSGLGRVELIDPNYSGESAYCKFYTDIGMPCVLLSLDFNQLRSTLHEEAPQ